MKINEIALNENVWTDAAKLAGKALPRIERLPGETMKDAITRAKSELGGVKSADNLVSPEELSALRAQASTPSSSGPAVWTKRGDLVPSSVPPSSPAVPSDPAVWRRRPPSEPVAIPQRNPTSGPAAMNLQAAERMRQASAERRAAAPKPAEAPPADDWTKQVGSRTSETLPAADDLAQQIRPGKETPKTTGDRREPSMNQPASGENKLSIDDVERLHKLWTTNPAAAQAAEKEVAKKSSFPWKTTAAAAAFLGPTAYNQFSPPTAPKLSNTPLSLTGDALVSAGKNFMANHDIPGIDSVTPVSNNQPVAPPAQDAVQKAIKSDPENQAVSKEIDDWNKKHPDNPIKESYTNELNRLVYLSRL
jgi:hypothetical protein